MPAGHLHGPSRKFAPAGRLHGPFRSPFSPRIRKSRRLRRRAAVAEQAWTPGVDRLLVVLQQLGAPDLLDTFLFEGFDSIDEVLDCDLRFDDYIELGADRYLALALWSCFRSLAGARDIGGTTA